MTPLPKRRWSTRRQGKKRVIFKSASMADGKCPHCAKPKSPHLACKFCGFYNGEQVIKVKTKKIKEVENK